MTETLSELKERARKLVTNLGTNANQSVIQLIEELCIEGDRITEEAKRDHDDLNQQVSTSQTNFW